MAVLAVWTQNPYYMVEFKPALGWVFREYLKEYTHWAYGDLDVFFGDLTKGWLEASEMRDYDIVTYRSVGTTHLHFHVFVRNSGCSNVPYTRVLLRPAAIRGTLCFLRHLRFWMVCSLFVVDSMPSVAVVLGV